MAQKIKIFVISSVVPNGSGYGGELVLHRYLDQDSMIEHEVFSISKFPLRLKVIAKLKQLGFRWIGGVLECLWPVYPDPKEVDRRLLSFNPDLILTVAHAWWHLAAVKAAHRNDLPLLTFFQDWWPDYDDVPKICRRRVKRIFMRTARLSDKVIAISQGMIKQLGNPRDAYLIHDLPSQISPVLHNREFDGKVERPLRLVYFGNLAEYGPMIEAALKLCEDRIDIELHVFGPKPHWDADVIDHYRNTGRYHGSLLPDEMNARISDFDAILVAMSFDERMKNRMMTSFPSKLIEGVQHGLPIIVWGPDYCSAVEWARSEGRAMTITAPSAEAVIRAIDNTNTNGNFDLSSYVEGSRLAAVQEFSPDEIRSQFRAQLTDMLESEE